MRWFDIESTNGQKERKTMYIRRNIFGHIIAESVTYPTSTIGWFKVCPTTGEEIRLP